jgi:hypothetical protein
MSCLKRCGYCSAKIKPIKGGRPITEEIIKEDRLYGISQELGMGMSPKL